MPWIGIERRYAAGAAGAGVAHRVTGEGKGAPGVTTTAPPRAVVDGTRNGRQHAPERLSATGVDAPVEA